MTLNPTMTTNTDDKALSDDERWQAVLRRDRSLDGAFVFAVSTTGIYCRTSCPARRPKREHVRFFRLPHLAEQAGYRACRRCRPHEALSPAAELVERGCVWIERQAGEPVRLDALGRELGVTPSHLQRTFKRLLGITPRQYAEAIRLERLKTRLRAGDDVTSALYDAGYGSISSLYEQAGARLGMTPNTYRRGGEGMQISYTIVDCPLGRLLVGATERGVCAISLSDDDAELEQELRAEYPAAEIRRDDTGLRQAVDTLVGHLDGRHPELNLTLDIQATAFQQRVWSALQTIPYGETRSYAEIARQIGQPSAVRAVARACAGNRVALAIPCHRVVRGSGELGGYRWGTARKQQLLDRERAGRS